MEATTNVSLEAWLQFAKVPKIYTVAVAYGSDRAYAPYDLFFSSGGTIVAQFYTTAGVLEVKSPSPLAVNKAYHIVGTFNGTTGCLYVNGALVATGTKTGSLTGYTPKFRPAIGDDAQLEDPAFSGTLDEVAIYANQTLTAAQVANHYAAGTTAT